MANKNLCMGCMRELKEERICPNCGFSVSETQNPPFLSIGTVTGGRYLIGKVLQHNGEGATYIGYDLERNIIINIREFLPETLVSRAESSSEINILSDCEHAFSDCMQSFLELWRKLARMRGLSALICVIDIIEDNNTAYAIFEPLHECMALRDLLLETATGYIDWEFARQLFMPVLSTLGTLHSAGIIHRGISPNTLLLGKDGKLIITGFSIGQVRSTGGDLPVEIFSGYAPIEQYGFSGQQGPWTDIYAFAATLYRSLVGSTPIEATTRITNDKLMIPAKFAELIPAYVINGLIKALQIKPEDRTKNVEAMRNDFSASPIAAVQSGYSTFTTEGDTGEKKGETELIDVNLSDKKSNRKTTALTFAVSAIICFAALGAVLYFVYIDRYGEPATTKPSVLSGETTMITVVNFVGQSSDILYEAYYTTNYDIKVNFVFNPDVEQGIIVRQSVPAGSTFSSAQRLPITIDVSKGIEYIKLKLSDYVGKSYESVKTQLEASGLKINLNESSYKNDELAGTIALMTGGAISNNELTAKRGDMITVYVYIPTATEPETEPPETDDFGIVINDGPYEEDFY